MRETEASGSVYRFGSFELDPRAGELRKHGIRIKLQDQPLQIFLLLLEHPGDVITREEIQNRLWPPGTHVDYDNAINSAMRKLRDALGDTSENPRFIETLARRGYRFVGHIESPRIEKAVEPPAVVQQAMDRPAAGSKWKTKFLFLASGALLLFGAVIAWWLLRSRPEPERDVAQLTPVPLTAATGWEDGPEFSPDGDQVAYTWNRTENPENNDWHIYLKSIGPGKPLRLTAGPGWYPAWSRDGRVIAFLRFRDSAEDIYVVPSLGGAARKVSEGFAVSKISWSPDGRFIAAAAITRSEPSSLYLVDVENGDRLRLTTPPNVKPSSAFIVAGDINPAFSPDGRSLLFTRSGAAYRGGLYLLDLGANYRPAGLPRPLGDNHGSIAGAAWTADGREVVYSLSDDGTGPFHLTKVRLETSERPKRIGLGGEQALWPAIAPRGKRLAYTQYLSDTDIWQIQSGKPPRSFVSSTREDGYPEYSPDGNRVAFSSDRSGLQQIWVCDQDGGDPTQLTRFDTGPSGTPRWSPDGHWIVFDREVAHRWGIFVMAADGGQVRKLTSDEGDRDEYIPSWSRDGGWIYYGCNRTGRDEVWKAPAQGGKGTQVTWNGGFIAFESHDGKSLLYKKDEGNSPIWARLLGGGQERVVVPAAQGRAFAVVDDGIYYFAPSRPDGSTPLRFHSFGTRKNLEIAPIKNVAADGMSVSPDRKTILFSVAVRSGSNVMVVDNFR